MASIQAEMMNLIFRMMPKDEPGQPHDYEAERKRNDRKPANPPKGVKVLLYELNGFEAEEITKEGNNNGVILYIHGGGFTVGSARERRNICQQIASQYGYDCISINYRLAPENRWPAMIEDCVTAYRQLLKRGMDPARLVFMGESAGGTLSLSLALAAKKEGLPMPRAIVAFSPCTDQYAPLPSHSANADTDAMMGHTVEQGLCDVLFAKKPQRERLKDPLLSPYYGNYEGLPPVYLSASDSEALRDDSILLYEKLKQQGHTARLNLQSGVPHAFQVFPFIPETKTVMKEVFEFLGELK